MLKLKDNFLTDVLFLIVLLSTSMCLSCSDDRFDGKEDRVSSISSDCSSMEGVVNFKSRNDLYEAIASKDMPTTRSTVARFQTGDRFISLMDVITPLSPDWNEFSKEEQDSITKNNMTYYEALGYEDLVPNEDFAKFLNYKGEVVVDDSLYRITPLGTFCADTLNYKDIDECYDMLMESTDSISFDSLGYIKLSPTVTLYNSFSSLKKNDFEYNTRATGSSIPLKYYSTKSNGWVWRKLASIFGDRSTKHFEYLSNKRINGSLYDYDYKIYYESGVFVSASRKRGGFFKKINGWKDINADELDITCKNLIFKLDYKTPSSISIPNGYTFISNNNTVSTNLSCSKLKTIDILGKNIDYKTFANILKLGIKTLSQTIHHSISSDTKVVRCATPNVMYIGIIECSTPPQKNVSKVRKVFNSGSKFYISSNILKNPFSVKAAFDLYKGLDNIPVQHIESGRVILTSKIDGQWGGLVIDKNYNGGVETIIK